MLRSVAATILIGAMGFAPPAVAAIGDAPSRQQGLGVPSVSTPDAYSVTVAAVTDGQFQVTNHDTGALCTTNTGSVTFVVDLLDGQGIFTAESQCGVWTIQFPTNTCALRTPYDGVRCLISTPNVFAWASTYSRLTIRELAAHDLASSQSDWSVRLTAAVGSH